MNENEIDPAIDAMTPLAWALCEHANSGDEQEIFFRRDDGIWYEQSTAEYFSVPEGLEEIETMALNVANGRILDVGAATGRHALALQEAGHRCTAIDIHPDLTGLMRSRGVVDARCEDVYSLTDGPWDTVLFMMETIGIAGTLNGLTRLLDTLHNIVTPGGQILLNGQPVLVADDDEEEALVAPAHGDSYPGELQMQMRYGNIQGSPFQWLYIDPGELDRVAHSCDWSCQIILEHAQSGHYLAKLLRE